MHSKCNLNKESLEPKIFFCVMCMVLKIRMCVLYKHENQEMHMTEVTNCVIQQGTKCKWHKIYKM